MKPKRLKPGQPGYRHPYVDYETDPLWPLVEKAVSDLVRNQDLTEHEDRSYVVGYICKVIRTGIRTSR